MRFSSLWSSSGELPPLLRVGLILAAISPVSHAININPIPPANLDFSKLGSVGLAGDFSGISLYEFEGQNQNGFSTNGSASILTRLPNGAFVTLAAADAGIEAMCSFVLKDGSTQGVVVGGNFTSLGGMESPGAALIDPNTSKVTALTGISGQVYSLLCDPSTNSVYVGGNFRAANSTNAIVWVGGGVGWTNLPFQGFNGQVSSITKASNGNIVFGGNFTGLGNATGPSNPDQQIVNISGANITSTSSTATTGFSDPMNIICKTGGVDDAGNTWLLADNTPGAWKASFGFGFQPTKLRLYNTHLDGRGTKTWRFTAQPINGIMNFTYVDPSTGQNASCSSECPLSSNSSLQFQDFHFVNRVGMDEFQIDISAFYGSGGGLNGIELFEDDIFAYAINDFNEPTCSSVQVSSNATSTGSWRVTPSGQSVSQYLTATINSSTTQNVVFMPDIKQSGNYSINMYTPGCRQDNSCVTRGEVNVTGVMESSGAGFTNRSLFQTNDFDKYDQIFFGYVDATSSSFRPTVTLSPATGQNIPNLSVVAQRVEFILTNPNSTGGLKDIFEYNPQQAVITTSDFANSTFDKAGNSIETGPGVKSFATSGNTTFVAGDFTAVGFRNIFSITDSGVTPLPGGSLNGAVATTFLNGTSLYVGGNFTNTNTSTATGLNNVAVYDTSKNAWAALGAGVNGAVKDIVPLQLNVSANKPETVITLTGNFNQLLAFGSNKTVTVTGFAVWVPSRGNWLQNLDAVTIGVDGQLTASVDLPGGGSLFAGTLSSSQLNTNGVVQVESSSSLTPFPVRIQPQQAQPSTAIAKREASSQNGTGVIAGLFYGNGGRNVTVLGGHFTATGSNGSDVHNLVFINATSANAVTGIGSQIASDSTFHSLALQDDTLWAGGAVTGTVNNGEVNGLLSYNLATSAFGTQPPALSGSNVAVNSISVRPNTADIYAGGSFESAGSLQCPGVCVFSTTTAQWVRPGSNLAGLANTMKWGSTDSLVAGGALTLNGANASLVTYDAKAQNWTAFDGSSVLPGPVTTMEGANRDLTQLWVAGSATNGSAFIMKYDGSTWNSVGNTLGSGSQIRGLKLFDLTTNHASSALMDASRVLLITGSLNLPGFGNASAVLFNGTAFQPYALTNSNSNTGGSLSQFFSAKEMSFPTGGGRIAVGLIVLIALACSLGIIFLMVVAGVIAERIRRKREGYMPAPTSAYDRNSGMARIPPEQLFGSLGQGRSGVEMQSTRI
ncbi:cortical protein marker for cell polarity-domain-containing protein [Amylocarpus encephaloides]|uniref:Cortical protein marker for cell polarity-domain-containing protein n=1 Tax=Amylocarpus encephaloides TaxID=45428 RepID=A0A9P7YM65_9HELO|nr:cortical protein marker for cell polarity-domain-containing protein [Amylocarpus encephaloides]